MEKIKLYEDMIDNRMSQRGWSKINSANDLLHDLMTYINYHYSDNGNTLTLKIDDGRK